MMISSVRSNEVNISLKFDIKYLQIDDDGNVNKKYDNPNNEILNC